MYLRPVDLIVCAEWQTITQYVLVILIILVLLLHVDLNALLVRNVRKIKHALIISVKILVLEHVV